MNPESLEKFLAWQAPFQPSLVQDKLLTPGSVMFLYGEYSTWKSWLAMDLAHSIADGKHWLLWATRPAKVLIINAELPKAEYQARWKAYLKLHTIKNPDNLMMDNDQEMSLDSYNGINNYITWLQFHKIKVLIIDNLYTAMTGDLSKNTDANLLIRNMKRISANGIAIVLVHHSRQERFDNHGKLNQRAYEMFGSSFLTNWADTILETRSVYVPGYPDAITLTPQKHRMATHIPLTACYNFSRSQLDFNLMLRLPNDATTNVNGRSSSSIESNDP